MRTTNQAALTVLPQPLFWLPIGVLAAVYGAFTLSWVIYRIHLPGLVTQFGFSEAVAPTLLLIEAILAIGIEPIMGRLSDRTEQRQGSRFPVITPGLLLASGLFVVIPIVALVLEPSAFSQWLMVGLLLLWGIAMSLFRSPLLALLRQYAPAVQLPKAASLLTLTTGLAGAVMPLGRPLVQALGISVSFLICAVLLVGVGAWLKSIRLPAVSPFHWQRTAFSPSEDGSTPLVLIFGLGFGVTLAFRLAIDTFPKVLQANLPEVAPPLFNGMIFLTLAVAALPLGYLAVRWGNAKAMLLGIGGMAVGLGIMPYGASVPIALMIVLLIGIGFSLITNGILPFALNAVSWQRSGLGMGCLFAGVSAATSLQSSLLSQPETPVIAVWIGIIALFVAGGSVVARMDRMP